MSYYLQQIQVVPIGIDEAWDFFSRPENLQKLTPSDVGFEIIHNNSEFMYEGQIICYKIQIAPLVKLTWVTEITTLRDKEMFVDDQRVGPYSLWHHTHRFEEVAGGVRMTDEVHYAIPFGIFGKLAHLFFVKKKLEKIFSYRRKAIDELFSEARPEGKLPHELKQVYQS